METQYRPIWAESQRSNPNYSPAFVPERRGVVTGMNEETPATLEHIRKTGLKPGTRIAVLDNAFLDGLLTAKIGELMCKIGPEVASIVRVRRVKPRP